MYSSKWRSDLISRYTKHRDDLRGKALEVYLIKKHVLPTTPISRQLNSNFRIKISWSYLHHIQRQQAWLQCLELVCLPSNRIFYSFLVWSLCNKFNLRNRCWSATVRTLKNFLIMSSRMCLQIRFYFYIYALSIINEKSPFERWTYQDP